MTLAVNIAQGGSNNVTMRNRIINGAMVIDQRNAGASVTASTTGAYTYTLDRWAYYTSSAASKFTVQQTPSATETGYATRVGAGFTNYLACTSTSAYSVSSTDLLMITQKIEGYNIADLAWGTVNAKAATLSFWAYSSLTGAFGGSLFNSANTNSMPFSYTILSANTWTYITVPITAPTSVAFGTGTSAGVNVNFVLGAGSTNVGGTSSTWTASGTIYWAPSGSTSVVGTNGATFYITGVQLEAGTTASPFENRQYGTELALCQRYCFVFRGDATGTYANIGNAIALNATSQQPQFNLPVPMRAQPTLSYSAIGDLAMHLPGVVRSTLTALSVITSQMGGAGVIRAVLSATTASTGSFTSGIILSFEFNNTSTGWLAMTAEL